MKYLAVCNEEVVQWYVRIVEAENIEEAKRKFEWYLEKNGVSVWDNVDIYVAKLCDVRIIKTIEEFKYHFEEGNDV